MSDTDPTHFISENLDALQAKLRTLGAQAPSRQRNSDIIEVSRQLRKISAYNRDVARQIRETSVRFRTDQRVSNDYPLVTAAAS